MDQKEKFDQINARLGEFFQDYALFVRMPEGLAWRATDESWAMGAAKRYLNHVSDEDRAKLFIKIQEEGCQ